MPPSLPLQQKNPQANNEDSGKKRPAFPTRQEISACLTVLSYVDFSLVHTKNQGTLPQSLEEVLVKVASIQRNAKKFVRPAKTAEEIAKEKEATLKRKAQDEIYKRLKNERARVLAEECRSKLPKGYPEKVKREMLTEFGMPLDTPMEVFRTNTSTAKPRTKKRKIPVPVRTTGPVEMAIAEAMRRCDQLRKNRVKRLPKGAPNAIKVAVLEEFGLPLDTRFPSHYPSRTPARRARTTRVNVTKVLELEADEELAGDEGDVTYTSVSMEDTGRNERN